MGCCSSETLVLSAKLAVQAPMPALFPVRVQSMPAGALTIRPPPTDCACATTDNTLGTNVAVTTRGACIEVWQVASVQSPLNARKTEVLAGSVCSVTSVPGVNRAVQVPLTLPALSTQSMPAGSETTLPLPVPLPETESATVVTGGSVTCVGVREPPEQADNAATATNADSLCRVLVARRRRADGADWRMAERKRAQQQDVQCESSDFAGTQKASGVRDTDCRPQRPPPARYPVRRDIIPFAPALLPPAPSAP